MNKKEILTKLIEVYKAGYIEVKKCETAQQARSLCTKLHIFNGICQAAQNIFHVDISKQAWIKERVNLLSGHWCMCPHHCNSKKMVLFSLAMRIHLMKNILSLY